MSESNKQKIVTADFLNGVIEVEVHCPQCKASDRRTMDARIVEVSGAECPECGHLFTFQSPLSAELAALRAKLDVAVEALDGLTSEVTSIMSEVDGVIQSLDMATPQEWLTREGTDGHTTHSMMRGYAEYVLDQTVNTIRYLECVNGMKRKLQQSRDALTAIRGEGGGE